MSTSYIFCAFGECKSTLKGKFRSNWNGLFLLFAKTLGLVFVSAIVHATPPQQIWVAHYRAHVPDATSADELCRNAFEQELGSAPTWSNSGLCESKWTYFGSSAMPAGWGGSMNCQSIQVILAEPHPDEGRCLKPAPYNFEVATPSGFRCPEGKTLVGSDCVGPKDKKTVRPQSK